MIISIEKCFVFLGLLRVAAALPQGSAGDGNDDVDIVDTVPSTSTVVPSATLTGAPAEVTENATPIPSSNSYWWIDGSCNGATPDGQTKWKFIEEAYNDATEIANVAKKWPDDFTAASDMYIGRNFHLSQYMDDFKANLAAAGAWQSNSPWPFQSYVRVSCNDLANACGGKIGSDPRRVTGYANNTKGFFGQGVYRITMCDPFFTLNSVASIKRFMEPIKREDLEMIYMESSGEKFLHEAMHLLAITEDREHIVDQTFDGGRRIYGARDVARAARITATDGFDLVYKNADTYAVFAQAAYWQSIYGIVPPPTIGRRLTAPPGAFEFDGVQDSEDNYVQYVQGSGPKGDRGQQVAVASYVHPLADPDAWSRMISYDKSKLSVLVANIVNGPDTTTNEEWEKVINDAVASGKVVIGYVRTGYLGVSHQQFKTRLGSGDLADWTAQIERDVDLWYQLYPGKIGGIFFDEGWNECGEGNQYAELYRQINENTKRKYPGAYTVLNPGAGMPQCFEHSADTLLTFESSYERYIDTSIYQPNDWVADDPRKIWHIIYNVPQAEIGRVAALAKERGVGYVEITDDVMPNPYDNTPNDSYMKAVLDAVSGGTPLIADAPSRGAGGAPSPGQLGLAVDGSDYSSVSLSWSSMSGAAEVRVMIDGELEFVSLSSSMNRVTIGNLASGSDHSFIVVGVGSDGTQVAATVRQSASTKALPGGKAIANAQVSTAADSSTYQADIFVPYAFVRLYIFDNAQGCDFTASPGWPINYNQQNYVCTKYMVEGDILYKYSGEKPEAMVNAPWAWTSIGTAKVEQDGYSFKWTLPIGTSTGDTSAFVIQVEGYGPKGNVFVPCPALGGGPSGEYGYCG